jgi:ATP phosphoribosyltransferase
MLRIALPNKGRLADEARALFAEAGLGVRALGDRALTASLGGEFQALFVRAQDVAEFVADGAADAGVTGWDLVAESDRALETLLDLEFGRCRLVVASHEESGIMSLDDITDHRVATVFPRLTRNYFQSLGRPVSIVPVSGAAEVAPHLGIADVIVDLVSTGSTLKTNGLRELGTVLESTARLVGPKQGGFPATVHDVTTAALRSRDSQNSAAAKRRADLDDLVTALDSVVRGRGKRYLMANVPRTALDRVTAVLPGLNGPTVIDIMNGHDMVAVHAVVPADGIYRTIAALKGLGAEGILVTRIERLLP